MKEFTGTEVPAESETYMGVWTYERSTSEDCLVLNVWTPTSDRSARLPVVVWLHGGGLSIGSASWPLYDFANLARNHDLVVVGINHRLGVLGFLDASHLGQEFAESGNVGLLDVVKALQWVQTNVASFGGDPGNVTVFGESGGGAKTHVLLAMPQARGLFHKAFPMSGAIVLAQDHERAVEKTEVVLGRLGGGDAVRALEDADVRALIRAEAAIHDSGGLLVGRGRGFAPVLGPGLPQHPVDAIAGGSAVDVAVVSGCTTDEMLSFMMSDPDLWTLDEAGLRGRMEPLVGADTDRLLAGYRAARPHEPPTSLLIAVTTDAAMRMPHIRLAEAKLRAGGAAVWMYLFAWGHPDPTGRVRSGHGSDMPYFFDNVEVAPIAAGPHAASLVADMSGALASLAHTGDPNHEGLSHWPAYRREDRQTMIFDLPSETLSDPYGAERRCWDEIVVPGLGYS
jgi:para-nitrobenzyl esterase